MSLSVDEIKAFLTHEMKLSKWLNREDTKSVLETFNPHSIHVRQLLSTTDSDTNSPFRLLSEKIVIEHDSTTYKALIHLLEYKGRELLEISQCLQQASNGHPVTHLLVSASTEFIDSPLNELPQVNVEPCVMNEKVDNDTEAAKSPSTQQDCPVCTCRMTDKVARPDCCDHQFCVPCLLKWSARRHECPLDRKPFEFIFIYKDSVSGLITKRMKARRVKKSEEEAERLAAWTDLIICQICHSGDNEDILLLCDSCDAGYHIYCLNPPMFQIPVDDWFCTNCESSQMSSIGSGQISMATWRVQDENASGSNVSNVMSTESTSANSNSRTSKCTKKSEVIASTSPIRLKKSVSSSVASSGAEQDDKAYSSGSNVLEDMSTEFKSATLNSRKSKCTRKSGAIASTSPIRLKKSESSSVWLQSVQSAQDNVNSNPNGSYVSEVMSTQPKSVKINSRRDKKCTGSSDDASGSAYHSHSLTIAADDLSGVVGEQLEMLVRKGVVRSEWVAEKKPIIVERLLCGSPLEPEKVKETVQLCVDNFVRCEKFLKM